MSTGRERSGVKPTASSVVTIVVNGETVIVDPNTLTMRERQQIKSALAKLDYPADDMDALVATIWAVMRRSDPRLTFDDVCGSITTADLNAIETSSTNKDDDSPEA
jgi:hypothetical protein